MYIYIYIFIIIIIFFLLYILLQKIDYENVWTLSPFLCVCTDKRPKFETLQPLIEISRSEIPNDRFFQTAFSKFYQLPRSLEWKIFLEIMTSYYPVHTPTGRTGFEQEPQKEYVD